MASIRRAVARSNKTLGRSAVAHARASSHPNKSACTNKSESRGSRTHAGSRRRAHVRRLTLRIHRQAARIADDELLGDAVGDDLRHFCRSREKRAQEPHSAQLHGEPEPVVIAAAAVDQHPISLIEMKEPLELRR